MVEMKNFQIFKNQKNWLPAHRCLYKFMVLLNEEIFNIFKMLWKFKIKCNHGYNKLNRFIHFIQN